LERKEKGQGKKGRGKTGRKEKREEKKSVHGKIPNGRAKGGRKLERRNNREEIVRKPESKRGKKRLSGVGPTHRPREKKTRFETAHRDRVSVKGREK